MSDIPAGFQWPWQYNFPPFFTIQPNSDTQAKQVEAWCELVLAYYKATKTYVMDVNEAQSSPIFYNRKINRILNPFPNTCGCVMNTFTSSNNYGYKDFHIYIHDSHRRMGKGDGMGNTYFRTSNKTKTRDLDHICLGCFVALSLSEPNSLQVSSC